MNHISNWKAMLVVMLTATSLSHAEKNDSIDMNALEALSAIQVKEYIGNPKVCHATITSTQSGKIVAVFSEGRYLQAFVGQPSTFLILNKKRVQGKTILVMNHIRSTQLRYLIKISEDGPPTKCVIQKECTLTNAKLELSEQLDIGYDRMVNILSSPPILITEYCKEKSQKIFYTEKWYEKLPRQILNH